MGLANGDVKWLFCEQEVKKSCRTLPAPANLKRILADTIATRQHVAEMHARINSTVEKCCVDLLSEKESALLTKDPTFIIEIRFFKAVKGPKGQECLIASAKLCMPSATNAFTPQQSHEKLTKLMDSPLFAFVDADGCGPIRAALSLVDQLRQNTPPTFPKNPSAFMQEVKDSMSIFCSATETSKTVFGVPAVASKVAALKRNTTACKADFEAVGAFGWLMTSSVRSDFQAAYDICKSKPSPSSSASASAAALVATTPQSKRKAADGPASAAKLAKKEKNEVDAALEMFRKKVR